MKGSTVIDPLVPLTEVIVEAIAKVTGRRLDHIRGTEVERAVGEAVLVAVDSAVRSTMLRHGNQPSEGELAFVVEAVSEALTRDSIGPALLSFDRMVEAEGDVGAEWRQLIEQRLQPLSETIDIIEVGWAQMVDLDLRTLAALLVRDLELELRARHAHGSLGGLLAELDTQRFHDALGLVHSDLEVLRRTASASTVAADAATLQRIEDVFAQYMLARYEAESRVQFEQVDMFNGLLDLFVDVPVAVSSDTDLSGPTQVLSVTPHLGP